MLQKKIDSHFIFDASVGSKSDPTYHQAMGEPGEGLGTLKEKIKRKLYQA